MFSRPLISGAGTTTCLSKRPGRSRAGSSTSGRFVAAITIIPSLTSNPSISTSSWLSVCSRSSLPPPSPAPRLRPTASISSMKMMHGACFFPCTNISRTRLAPTPTNISTKSDPLILKKGTAASPAIALASKVFPVPGSPISKTPLGISPPRRSNFPGSLRKSTISSSSSRDSSIPCTSPNFIGLSSVLVIRERILPKPIARLPPPCTCRIKKSQIPMIRIIGSQLLRMARNRLV